MDFRVPQIKDSDPGMGIIVIKTASKPNDLAYAEDLFHALQGSVLTNGISWSVWPSEFDKNLS